MIKSYEFPKLSAKDTYTRLLLKSNINYFKKIEVEGFQITYAKDYILKFEINDILLRRLKLANINGFEKGSMIHKLFLLLSKSNEKEERNMFWSHRYRAMGSYTSYSSSYFYWSDETPNYNYDDRFTGDQKCKERQVMLTHYYKNKVSRQLHKNKNRQYRINK